MSIPVLYDACVLYGNEVRDLLIRIAISGMVRAHWTDEIATRRSAISSRTGPTCHRSASW
jgi:hypothetical protein